MAKKKSDAERYLEAVQKGKITASKKIRKLADIMLPQIRGGYKEWHFDIEAANRPVHFIENYCYIPSGKLKKPFKLEPFQKAIVQTAFGFVDENGYRRFQEVLCILGRKNGKALSLDTDIPTPDGWKKMCDIHVGDVVFGQDGKPATVLAESPIFNKPMYLVTFEDGCSIKASADHIWTVKSKASEKLVAYTDVRETLSVKKRRRAFDKLHDGPWFEATTEELSKDFVHRRKDGKGVEYRYRVPMCSPVEYPEAELPIDPYTFGVWLGDGTSSSGNVTCSNDDKDEMMAHVIEQGHTVRWHQHKETCGAFLVDPVAKGSNKAFKSKLRNMGVLNNKHIPDAYMAASVEQRMELLRGLMDTDGYCSKNGQCEFAQKDRRLTAQVSELLASLGMKNSIREKTIRCNGKECKAYSVLFFTDKARSCFKLKRKHDRLKDSLSKRMESKSIVNIEPIPVEPSKCIMVDNPSHLYLAGRQYTATHNSSLLAALELYMLIADKEGAPQIYNVANSEEQAKLAYNAAIRILRQSKPIQRYAHKRADDVYCAKNLGYMKPLTSQTRNLDGLDVHFAVIDELSAILNRDLYDLVKQGMSAREQPMLFIITTNGFVRGGIFDNQYDYARRWLEGEVEDDRFLPFIYELDDREEWVNESAWVKANPGLGTIKKLEYLRNQVNKALQDASFRPTVLTKEFNLPENQATAWLDFEEAVNEETFDPKGMGFRYGICGFDAADTIDLTCAQMMMMRPNDHKIYEISMYWIPEDTILSASESGDRKGRDNVPYEQWIARGLLRTVPGNKVDKRVVIDWLEEVKQEYDIWPFAIGFDPWHIDDTTRREMESFVGKERAIPVRQGAITLSQPMKQIRADYKANRIVDNHNPINEWCRMNVTVKADVNGNIQPYKKDLNPTNRIDGFAAELDAYTTLHNLMDEYSQVT